MPRGRPRRNSTGHLGVGLDGDEPQRGQKRCAPSLGTNSFSERTGRLLAAREATRRLRQQQSDLDRQQQSVERLTQTRRASLDRREQTRRQSLDQEIVRNDQDVMSSRGQTAAEDRDASRDAQIQAIMQKLGPGLEDDAGKTIKWKLVDLLDRNKVTNAEIKALYRFSLTVAVAKMFRDMGFYGSPDMIVGLCEELLRAKKRETSLKVSLVETISMGWKTQESSV